MHLDDFSVQRNERNVLTLNFDFDLSDTNGKIRHSFWASA